MATLSTARICVKAVQLGIGRPNRPLSQQRELGQHSLYDTYGKIEERPADGKETMRILTAGEG